MSAPTVEEYRRRLPVRPCAPTATSGGPLVTLVTVTYNSCRTLPDTIAGIVAQDYSPIEWLVIDGGSSDRTVDLVSECPAVTAWLSERDSGISDAFNKGVAWSQGEIIGIINSDDRYLPGAVRAAVSALAADPAADFCFGDLEWQDDHGHRWLTIADPHYAGSIAYRMPQLHHPTVFVRRRAYVRHGLFRTDLRIAMDYDLLLRMHRGGSRGIRVPAALARMRVGGVSDRNLVARFSECRRVSILNRGSRPRAWLVFILMTVKASFRPVLERLGLWRFASRCRRILNPRYREL